MRGMCRLSLVALVMVAGAVPASSQNAASGWREGGTLKRLDTNNDGAVSVEEYLKRKTERFAKLDVDADGVLSEAEVGRSVRTYALSRRERLLRSLDEDKDGSISRIEFDRMLASPAARSKVAERGAGRFSPRSLAQISGMFGYLDRNNDGKIDAAELQAVRSEQTDYLKRKAMRRLDLDGDGKVTIEEFNADDRARFARLDLDRDGKITAADLSPEVRMAWAER